MVEDTEGFLYPQVDEEACVNCGLCEKVCNELQPYDTREPLQVLAAINQNYYCPLNFRVQQKN